jgi:hypothetical protein
MNNTTTRVLILCAGDGTRWGEYLGVPKQLMAINGEALLARTIRLARANGYHDIQIITHDERLHMDGAGVFRPARNRWTVETLLSTRELWTDRTLVLLGDVFFTKRAMRRISRGESGIHIYGRPDKSAYYSCSWGEIFALSFGKRNRETLIAHANHALKDAENGGRGLIWEFYRSLCGFPFNEHIVEDKIFRIIDDLTDDFDSPEQYEEKIVKYGYFDTSRI